MTMLFDSVAPLVKMISDASHRRRRAVRSRACSMPALQVVPKLWLLDGLPYLFLKYGSISVSTWGATGVLAL